VSLSRVIATFAVVVLAACAPQPDGRGSRSDAGASVPASPSPAALRPVVIQGAMPSETDALVAALADASEQQVQGWTFWTGTIDGHPVVVSRTQKGTANAAAATALAIERFHPAAIVNQGTAGGHDPGLHVADIVIGRVSLNIGAFKTGTRAIGAGSDFNEWRPMDLIRTEGSAGQDPNAWVMHRFEADPALLSAAKRASDSYTNGRVVEGVIGSSDTWNSELDRIRWLHDVYGTSVEEMETAAAAQVAGMNHVPFLGIRVLSNNITIGGAYDGRTGEACQVFAVGVVREYLAATSRPRP
jgi:adenosylhomocysteine nucleosidase